MKILITGGNGYIAKSIHSSLSTKYDITLVGRQDFDLTNYAATCEFFEGKYFDVIIHTAVSGGSRLKPDSDTTLSDNLNMFWNLLANKSHYTRFVTFGSGAELYNSSQPYGLSKKVIADAMSHREGFYNLRIFGVFDENELDTRFIKSNIKRYLNKEAIQIFEDKMMDFIYMKDLITLVEHYINNDDLPKEIDCMYPGNKSYLYDIAEIINKLDNYEVPILSGKNASSYVGYYHPLNLDFIGLENGIKEVYEILRKQ